MIDWTRFDAALFDLDGVLTKTARVHGACWKRMFDEFLQTVATRDGTAFQPFDAEVDYARHVDGKPRFDGVRDFLASRGIRVPEGTPADPPSRETVGGLGNRKAALFLEVLETEGIDVYERAVTLARALRQRGLKTAVVSSSQNCAAILQAAGISALFDLRVDGRTTAALGLPGKPAPDGFLEASRRLGVEPARAVVIEDALAGVEAGRAGHFGLVVGVDRHGTPDALSAAGADLVVDDLGQVLPTR